jgi:ubiquinone/menaquinone biosynthesis C-methylase UbiE
MKLRSGTELIHPFKLLEHVGIRADHRVADLGCGALGHFVFPASELVGPNGKVYAVDIQRDVLAQVEKTAKQNHAFNIECVWSDIDQYGAAKIENGSLDLTLLINNLFLSQNRPELVREIARLAKPGGRVVVVEWKAIATPLGPDVKSRMSPEEAKQIFQTPLLKLEEEFEAGPYHYGIVYTRTEAAVT